jgi:thermostable 8-oxoguanine DNA glycosylase
MTKQKNSRKGMTMGASKKDHPWRQTIDTVYKEYLASGVKPQTIKGKLVNVYGLAMKEASKRYYHAKK